ncbi:2Fe-2S iron-sulfur cluster binding domain-containing protein [Spectribacter hydrogenoxidans]|uniref:2Fe-2S iron-sulfur cluster binding domain-containing protein n=1 Tax=Spectribacter hydrogenoxidans TaxID=3075608 RepID=A0ABU3C4C2_9GAMM|nr:2Fe-2S iron-sulfur cluster binding domain-containing protein [Salinisphaera sp. W335]MDT0636395.1 2Fe-2S iron-sulfur cluster binding domain-containing protein [Salinisphaera sp. W335]
MPTSGATTKPGRFSSPAPMPTCGFAEEARASSTKPTPPRIRHHGRGLVVRGLVAARSGHTLHVPAGRSLLDVLREHRFPVHSVCEQGLCGTGACRVVEGEIDHRDVVLSETAREGGVMTSCVSRAKGDRLVLDL